MVAWTHRSQPPQAASRSIQPLLHTTPVLPTYRQITCMRCMQLRPYLTIDGCIVWNAHNTVFGSKRSAICAQDVYFLHSTMPSVTCLRLSDVSVICRVTNFQFPIHVCFSTMSVSQASQRRTWFTQYRTSSLPKIWVGFFCTERTVQGNDFELILTVKWKLDIP